MVGTVLLSNATFTASGGSASRAAGARATDALSVLDFGATGDGATNDGTAIASAITWRDAATGRALYWPAGNYLTTTNIANLHAGENYGPGRIKRGSATFYLDLQVGQANALYCNPATGNDTNDGLSSATGFATRQRLFNVMAQYGIASRGRWNLNLGDGQTQETITTPFGFVARGEVYIYGTNVSGGTPTTIFDGASQTLVGPQFGPYGIWHVFDVLFRNFSGYGVIGNNFSYVSLQNCHATGNVLSGFTAEGMCRLFIYGGNYSSNSQHGGRFYSKAMGSILLEARYGTAAQFNNNSQYGFQTREDSNVRADDFTMDGNVVGGVRVENARAHLVNYTMSNMPVGVSPTRGASWTRSGATYTSVTIPELGVDELDWSSLQIPRHAVNNAEIVHTGTVALTTLWTGPTVPAIWFEDTSKSIEVLVEGHANIPGGIANLYVTLGVGTLALFPIPSGTNAGFRFSATVVPRGASSQRQTAEWQIGVTTPSRTRVTRTATTSAAAALAVKVALAATGDAVTIDRLRVSLFG